MLIVHHTHSRPIHQRIFHFLKWVLPPAARQLPHEMRQSTLKLQHQHHDGEQANWFQEQPRWWNFTGARVEFLLLQIINHITRHFPVWVIHRIIAPFLGMPVRMPQHQIVPVEIILKLIDDYESQKIPIRVGLCPCRRALAKYSPQPLRNYTDIVFGDWGAEYHKVLPYAFKQISYDTCRKMMQIFDQMGLVHTLYGFCGTGTMQAVVCNCATDVCVPMYFYRTTGLRSFTDSPYLLKYNLTKCNGCQECIPKCQAKARKWNQREKKVDISPFWCVGCGACRSVCPNGANSIVRNLKQPLDVGPQHLLI